MSEPTEAELNRPLWRVWDGAADKWYKDYCGPEAEMRSFAGSLNFARRTNDCFAHPITSNHGPSPDAVIAAAREMLSELKYYGGSTGWGGVCGSTHEALEKAIAAYDAEKEKP